MNCLVEVVLIALLVEAGSCMKCYQCDSAKDTDCQENFDHQNLAQLNVKMTDCQVDSAQFCIKSTGVWGGIVGTRRFCSSRDMGNQCQYITYPDHDRTYRACMYTCSFDGCNHSATLVGSLLMICIGAVTALLCLL